MFFSKKTLSAAIALMATGSVASADVTADDIWADFQAYMAGIGYEMTGTTTRQGNVLTASDVGMTGTFGPEAGTMEMQLGTFTLSENGDGSVDIRFPEVVPITTEFEIDDGVRGRSNMEYRQQGAVVTASGTPADLNYVFSADTISFVSDGLEIDGTETEEEIYTLRVDMSGLSGTTDMLLGSTRNYDQALNAETATYSMIFSDPSGEGEGRITGSMDEVKFTGIAEVPLLVAQSLQTDMNTMLGAGFAVDGTFTTGRNDVKIMSTTPDALFSGDIRSDASSLDVKMNEDGLTYAAGQSGMDVQISTPSVPFPIAFRVADTGFNLSMPLRTADTAGAFALGFSMEDFSTDEAIWALIDPGAQLPRDPATLILQITGKAKVLFDFLDPTALAAAQSEGETPAEIESADIQALRLDIAGAELTGTGAFTFDNSQDVGPPPPVGGVDLRLEGGNGLIDGLVAIGLLPEEQAMAARMMMGLLAVPGDAPDTLTSRIEINEQGHVMANGQRIQ